MENINQQLPIINTQTPSSKPKIFLIIIVLLFIIVLILSFVYFFLKNNKKSEQLPNQPMNQLPTANQPPPTTFNLPQKPISISGEIACIPHKDKTGPQTLECAIGLLGEDGKYYRFKNLSQKDIASGRFSTGKKVKIDGTIILQSSDIFDFVGYIDATSIILL